MRSPEDVTPGSASGPAPQSAVAEAAAGELRRERRRLRVVRLLLLLALAVAAASLWFGDRIGRADAGIRERLVRQVQLAGELRRTALAAAAGAPRAYARLPAERAAFDAGLRRLHGRHRPAEVPAWLDPGGDALARLEGAWQRVGAQLDRTLSHEEAVLALRDDLQLLEASVAELATAADALFALAVRSDWDPVQIHLARMQRLLARRVLVHVRSVAAGAEVPADVGARLDADNELLLVFGKVTNGFVLGDPAIGLARVDGAGVRPVLERMGAGYRQASEIYRNLSRNSHALVETLQAQRRELGDGGHRLARLVDAARELAAAHERGTRARATWLQAAAAAAGLLAVGLALGAWRLRRHVLGAGRRAETLAAEARRAEASRLRLEGVLAALAEGDLSVRAGPLEAGFGAAGEAADRALDGLRDRIAAAERSARELAAAVAAARDTAQRVSESAQMRAGRLARAGSVANELAVAEQGAAEAGLRSRAAAETLAGAARQAALAGRETPQLAAAARQGLDRVAESLRGAAAATRDLAGAVALVDDVAARAGVVAVNAAIRAGAEAEGPGELAAVAEQVQVLADEAGRAVQRADGIARALQAEVREALHGIESAAARLESAGTDPGQSREALRAVEQGAGELLERVAALAGGSAQQAERARDLARNLQAIQDLTSRIDAQASGPLGARLADLVQTLREALAAFRLSRGEAPGGEAREAGGAEEERTEARARAP